jgi:hypothetical protein
MKALKKMRTLTIPISSIVGGGICVSALDGQRVYERVSRAVAEGNRVVLSFSGVTRMTTAFLNAAVGQLYGEFSEEIIRERLAPPIDYEPWHLSRLKLVVDRAKVYFRDIGRAEKIILNITGDEDDEGV